MRAYAWLHSTPLFVACERGLTSAGFTTERVATPRDLLATLARQHASAVVVDATEGRARVADALMPDLCALPGQKPLLVAVVDRVDSAAAATLAEAGVDLLITPRSAERTLTRRARRALRRSAAQHVTQTLPVHRADLTPVLLDIALRLGQTAPKDLDAAVSDALHRFATAQGLDDAAVFLLDAKRELYAPWVRWHAGAPNAGRALPRPLTSMPWAAERLLSRRCVHVAHLGDLPSDAVLERRQLHTRGLHAWAAVPLAPGRDVVGFVSLGRCASSTHWSEPEVRAHDQFAQLLCQAWARRRPTGGTGDATRSSRWQLEAGVTAARAASALGREVSQMIAIIDAHAQQLIAEQTGAVPALGASEASGSRAPSSAALVPGRSVADTGPLLEAVEHMRGLGRQLAAFDVDAPARTSRVHLNDLVVDLDGLMRAMLAGRAPFALRCEAARPWVSCDPLWLRRVVAHALVAACDVGGLSRVDVLTQDDAGGVRLCVRVEGCRWSEAGVTTVVPQRPEAQVRTGQQVDRSRRSRAPTQVAEPGEILRGDDAREGDALPHADISGLLESVRARGLSVRIEARPRGADLTVTLPHADRLARGQRTAPFGGAPHQRVLVVDDDKLLRGLVVRILVREGYDVLQAADGEEALEVVRKAGGVVDLLVTDFYMPKMNGSLLARRLAEVQQGVRTLFMSAYANEDKLVELMGGPVAFLPKPFRQHQLANSLADLAAA